MLDRFLSSVFDEEHEFSDIWQLKLIKFDTDLEERTKHYEKNIVVANTIEDVKGNPNIVGKFTLTNLRVIWCAQKDNDVNLSIGLDTVNNVFLKSFPIQGYNDTKHVLTIKSMSPSGVKYEFKFAGFGEREQRIFKRVAETFKRCVQTKYLRNIDTHVKVTKQMFNPLEFQELKTRYEETIFTENLIDRKVTLILTNIRLIVVGQKSTETSYGIPWIMIESFSKIARMGRDALQIRIRGLLKGVLIFISCEKRSDFSKLNKQIVSFSESYTKNPILGTQLLSNEKLGEEEEGTVGKFAEIEEYQRETKVNIGRRKNAYGEENQRGQLQSTFFNEELGIMMERLPEGVTRNDLWQILPR